jgi:uncharacterized membrane protein HdeD (DUF308 family)
MAPESTPETIAPTPGAFPLDQQADELSRLRGLTQAEGLILIVLGLLALSFPIIASAWATLMVAVAFLVAGLFGWINNLSRGRRLSRWHSFGRLVIATLFLLAGCWMLSQFKTGLVPAALQIKALAVALGLVFLAEGLVATLVSLLHRTVTGWGWGLANGLVTLVLGLLILSMDPAGQLSVIGLLVGISFLFSGFDLLSFGVHFPSHRGNVSPAAP